ncbi:MAG: SdpI family protein [Candidatus Sericytochromatia bacterium]|nr:SdpI family protein [Candidatus Tanganyikabacteria bacterium]
MEARDGTLDLRVPPLQIVLVALMVVAGAALYPSLPDRLPMHWDVAGRIDRWADKTFWSVFFQPLLAAGMVALAWLLPRIDPLKASYARFRGSYELIIDLIVGFIAFLYAVTLYAAFDPQLRVDTLVIVGTGLLFAILGNQLSKVKRNFFVGIRTPWTLASEAVWLRTHRLGGRILMAAGLAATLTALLPPPWNFAVYMALIVGASVVLIASSYVIYRRLERAGLLSDGLG